jgi:hypothetical protein
MRKYRAEVTTIVDKFRAVEKDTNLSDKEKKERKLELLNSYNIPKWPGRKKDRDDINSVSRGDPITFLNEHYRSWIEKKVIFKFDIRLMDFELVEDLRDDGRIRKGICSDPLMTKINYTEYVAIGVFGDEFDQQIALATIRARPFQRQLARTHNGTVRFRK